MKSFPRHPSDADRSSSASSHALPIAERLLGLAPLVDDSTQVLVLGSFPGAASLQAQQYYGHPQNLFWRLMQSLWPSDALPPREDYAGRCHWLLAHGVGVWDVYASCERQGSLDSAIRNAQCNDFAALRVRCPELKSFVHNGAESFRHASTVARQWPSAQALPALRVPSSSPANASWNWERKQAAWAEAFSRLGLGASAGR